MPNAAAPSTNLQVMPRSVIVANGYLLHRNLAMFGSVAQSIIIKRLGSHFVKSSGKREKAKKAETLAGEAMPETRRPRPEV
ncbi:hypothetical protein BLS_002434 [Venturia inaequalis]|uniref:Uncharacterized protein n=1 Tax=Venturia inaequalis TaxID=5025 RepID=A0A8H3V8F5_VENIN|nr:hypothetical protein EG327_006498 [Venturia inaequalis]KAE9984404.1 hypothetical protein BLS_002434 [Venturia inaequalis]